MESNAKPAERTGERSRLRFWGLVFLLGPLPVCGGLALGLTKVLPSNFGPIPTCGFYGALWGLSSGVRSKHLSRMIIGLNAGALSGMAAGYAIDVIRGGNMRVTATVISAIALGILSGVLRMEKSARMKSFLRGFVAGTVALVSMGAIFFTFRKVLTAPFRLILNMQDASTASALTVAFAASAIGMALLLRGMNSSTDQAGIPLDRSSSNT